LLLTWHDFIGCFRDAFEVLAQLALQKALDCCQTAQGSDNEARRPFSVS
jgi:hypothetical protein